MERRFILGLGILLFVLAFAIAVSLGMKAIHAPGEEALAHAAQLSLTGDMEQAVSLAGEAYSRWQKYRSITAAFADHSPMDDTERLFQEMLVYAQSREIPHFAASCTQLSAMLKAIYETHSFSVKNIF